MRFTHCQGTVQLLERGGKAIVEAYTSERQHLLQQGLRANVADICSWEYKHIMGSVG